MITVKPWRQDRFAEVHHDAIGFMAIITTKEEHGYKFVADFSPTRNRYPEFIKQCFAAGTSHGAMFDMVLKDNLAESLTMLEERAKWLTSIINKEQS